MTAPAERSNNSENLDVVRTSRDQENRQPKASAAESAVDPHLSVVCPLPAQSSRPRRQRRRGSYRANGSKYISVQQATLLKRSNLQNQSSSTWWPTPQSIGR